MSTALLDLARRQARAGEITAALASLADAAPTDDDRPGRVLLLTTELDCRLARGELGPAMAIGKRLAEHLEAPGTAGAHAHHACGELAAATGEALLAHDHFARVAPPAGPVEDPAGLPWRSGAALAAVRLGRHSEGTALAREQVAVSRAARSAYGEALGLRALATVEVHLDRVALLREALALLETVPAARLAAQLRTDLAGLLLLGPESSAAEAIALLREAEEYAAREQLRPLQGRVRRLLVRSGQTPRPRPTQRRTLTAAEHRVARLAADGLTNREIAQGVLVSVKAVETHLSHAYRKLGIRSRAGLAEALGVALPLG